MSEFTETNCGREEDPDPAGNRHKVVFPSAKSEGKASVCWCCGSWQFVKERMNWVWAKAVDPSICGELVP